MSWTTTTMHTSPSPLSILTRGQRTASIASASSSSPPAPSETSKLEPPDVRKLAKMAQLEVTDEEVRGGKRGEKQRRMTSKRQPSTRKEKRTNSTSTSQPFSLTPHAQNIA